jgi:hypothetical protein
LYWWDVAVMNRPMRTTWLALGTLCLLSIVQGCGTSAASGQASAPRTVGPSATSEPSGSACKTPSTRALSAIAYDSATQNVVLFGGAGEDLYGDTWQWNATGWQLVKAPVAPSPRSTMAAAFDGNRSLVLVYGGRGASDTWLYDTWTWDGMSWTMAVVAQHPVLRFAMGAFDPQIGKVVVYGLTPDYSASQTWTWDGAWHQINGGLQPPPRLSSALAYDPSSHRVILFGGRSPDLSFLSDTWAFDGTGWKQLTPVASPAARQNHAMASISDGVVLFGGDAKGANFTDTWRWSAAGWQQIPAGLVPAALWGIGGMTSLDGGAFIVTYAHRYACAQTYVYTNGTWSVA